MTKSKYCYQGTPILINKPGIKDQEQLNKFESIVTLERLVELQIYNPINGQHDLKHLQDIHKFIFKDIYPFASKLRDVNISKGTFTFAYFPYIKEQAELLFQELKKENYLKGLDIDKFSERLAYYMAEINVLHPFREGNGRTQREFIRALALNAGYELDWSRENKDNIFLSSVTSVHDTKDLVNLIKKIVVKL